MVWRRVLVPAAFTLRDYSGIGCISDLPERSTPELATFWSGSFTNCCHRT
jgi:hypothetical protein